MRPPGTSAPSGPTMGRRVRSQFGDAVKMAKKPAGQTALPGPRQVDVSPVAPLQERARFSAGAALRICVRVSLWPSKTGTGVVSGMARFSADVRAATPEG